MSDANIKAGTRLEHLLNEQEMTGDSRQLRQLMRRQRIVETVLSEESVRIEALAERFDISLMTAHRDLDDLARRGLLHKHRGVVSVTPTSFSEASDVYRVGRQPDEKRAIAQAAADLLEPGETVFLDDSTTVQQMVPFLGQRTPLTVITNSVSLMNEVTEIRDLVLIGLGGRYHNWCHAFLGNMTISEINQLRADVLMVSTSAIIDGVAFHQSPEMVETKQAMFRSASRRILLADHSKFQQRALHHFADLRQFDAVIIDGRTDRRVVEQLRARGVNLRIAKGARKVHQPEA